jgi:hypothetical protein
MSDAWEEFERQTRELEASGIMKVRVIKCPHEVWYKNHVGEVFAVYKKPTEYVNGPAYKCVVEYGGIDVNDCEVAE